MKVEKRVEPQRLSTSYSKQMYSFSKSSRAYKAKKEYCASYYNLSSSFNHEKPGRAPSFGIGERLHSGRNSIVPPDKYNLKS